MGNLSKLTPGMRHLIFPTVPILVTSLFTPAVNAQISPDATLRNNSLVNLVGGEWQIKGGETLGNNLFHSFSNFTLK